MTQIMPSAGKQTAQMLTFYIRNGVRVSVASCLRFRANDSMCTAGNIFCHFICRWFGKKQISLNACCCFHSGRTFIFRLSLHEYVLRSQCDNLFSERFHSTISTWNAHYRQQTTWIEKRIKNEIKGGFFSLNYKTCSPDFLNYAIQLSNFESKWLKANT